MNDAWKDLHDSLIEAGWIYEGKRRGHHRYRAPEGHKGRAFLTLPGTPGRGRAYANNRSQLRKQGISVRRIQ